MSPPPPSPPSSSPPSSSHLFPTPKDPLNPPILRLRKSLIRPFNSNDAKALAKEANNPEIARWLRNIFPHPYGIEDAVKWINFATSSSPMLNFAICRLVEDNNNQQFDNTYGHNRDDYDDEEENSENPQPSSILIGGIGLKPFTDIYHRTLQLGYWLGEAHWNQGIITEAIKYFSDWTFEQECFAHVVRLEAEVFEGNDASGRALEKAGFVCEGMSRNAIEKNGVVMGVARWVRFREGW